jgi:hypothetical protein
VLLDLAKRYSDVIQQVEVERFRIEGDSYELRAVFVLADQSKLFVKDYLFLDGTRKYAYHWQSQEGQFISRWDNAPHWKAVESYPHHRHAGSESVVEVSHVRTLEDVLKYIRGQIKPV